jgi:hypothetical protein
MVIPDHAKRLEASEAALGIASVSATQGLVAAGGERRESRRVAARPDERPAEKGACGTKSRPGNDPGDPP